MRYLLHETQQSEMEARENYLFDVFRMYFVPREVEGGFIILRPIGADNTEILFITGHANYVEGYFKSYANKISEKIIVITSCKGQAFRQYIKKKDVYVPNLKHPYCRLRDGKPYGFGFDISDEELNLYNMTGTIIERIQSAYDRLK